MGAELLQLLAAAVVLHGDMVSDLSDGHDLLWRADPNNLILKSEDAGATWQLTFVGGRPRQLAKLPTGRVPLSIPDDKAGIQRRYYSLSFQINTTAGPSEVVGRSTGPPTAASTAGRRRTPTSHRPSSSAGCRGSSQLRRRRRWPRPVAARSQHRAARGDLPDAGRRVHWTEIQAPDTDELHGLQVFDDAAFVADWSGQIWRWNGSLVDAGPCRPR